MANVMHPDTMTLWRKHQASVMASLERRLEIARAKQDQTLIQLLEQEQQQVLGTARQRVGFKQQLVTLWADITAWMRGDSQMQVWQTVDRQGDRWWCAYNPQTGESLYSDSEQEMRIWIEQHYPAESY